jgi:hypothetical protein
MAVAHFDRREHLRVAVIPPPFIACSEESRLMLLERSSMKLTLAQQVECRVRQSTHGRIRNLEVEEVQGRVVVRGQVPSHHTKQLALQGALELLSGDRFSSNITVV